MQSLAGVVPSAQLTAPPKALKAGGEDKFAPALKQATKDAERGDELAGAASVSSQHDANRGSTEKVADGKTAEGKTAEGKTVEGKTAEGKTAEGKTAEGKTAEGKTAEGKTAEGKTAEGKTAEGKTAEGETGLHVATEEMAAFQVANGAAAGESSPQQGNEAVVGGAVAVGGLVDDALDPDVGGTTEKGPVVENLAKGAEIAAEVQNRLKGSALKTDIIEQEGRGARPVAAGNPTSQQPHLVEAATESGMLEDNAPVIQQIGNSISAEKTGHSKAKVITDPRFASLLNKPEVPSTLRQQQNISSMDLHSGVAGVDSEAALFGQTQATADNPAASLPADGTVKTVGEFGAALGGDELTDMQFTSAETMKNGVHSQLHSGTQGTHAGNNAFAPEAVLSLKDGSFVPESRVVQQTIDHLSLHARGDSSSVTIKLHPEELGELQLRMVMEGDKLRVHLQTQSQQVQEVLERNFPRLRDALQDAGVNVSDFQVSSDAGGRGNQQDFDQNGFAHSSGTGIFSGYADDEVDPLAAAMTATALASGDSLSVRV